MEKNTENIKNYFEEDGSLSISNNSMIFLSETGKWGKFLAIMGFIGVGFLVVLSLFMGTLLSSLNPGGDALPIPGFLFGLIYLILAALYFFPVLYLFNFSSKIRKALAEKDNSILDEAFKNLKSHYKFIGILTVILLMFYVIFGLGSILIALLVNF